MSYHQWLGSTTIRHPKANKALDSSTQTSTTTFVVDDCYKSEQGSHHVYHYTHGLQQSDLSHRGLLHTTKPSFIYLPRSGYHVHTTTTVSVPQNALRHQHGRSSPPPDKSRCQGLMTPPPYEDGVHDTEAGDTTPAKRKATMTEIPSLVEPAEGVGPKSARLSLAATHPVNYGAPNPKATLPSPPCSPEDALRIMPPPPTKPPVPQPSRPQNSSRDVQYQVYTDPMLQTSTEPNYWSTNGTVLRADTRLEPGNVISPTCMVGLPFGSMTEMCVRSSSEEQKAAGSSASR